MHKEYRYNKLKLTLKIFLILVHITIEMYYHNKYHEKNKKNKTERLSICVSFTNLYCYRRGYLSTRLNSFCRMRVVNLSGSEPKAAGDNKRGTAGMGRDTGTAGGVDSAFKNYEYGPLCSISLYFM